MGAARGLPTNEKFNGSLTFMEATNKLGTSYRSNRTLNIKIPVI